MNKNCTSEFATFHPLVIFLYFGAVTIITMTLVSPYVILVSLVASWVYSLMLKGKKTIKFNLIITLCTTIFTSILNTFFTHDGQKVLFYINNNRITLEAFCYGLFSGILISTIIIWFSCFNHMVNGEMIMYFFGKISALFGMLISMVFRYIPLLQRRYEEISVGQKCLGKDEGKNLIGKIKMITKKISILISWSLESSIESADSMADRGYGLKGKTTFNLYKWSYRDYIIGGIMIALILAVMISAFGSNMNMYFYPTIVLPSSSVGLVVGSVTFGIISFLPIIIDVLGDYRWKKLESAI